jgi:hypothetical protein
MQSKDYATENICKAMGLVGFSNDPTFEDHQAVIRLVLMPSFHPELCITLTANEREAILSTIALTNQFDRRPDPTRSLPIYSEKIEVSRSEFEKLFATARALAHNQQLSETSRGLDGMSFSCLIKDRDKVWLFEDIYLAQGQALVSFVGAVLLSVYENVQKPECRNAIAQVGYYVSRELPFEERPDNLWKPRPQTEKERQKLREAIRRVMCREHKG